jgi:hypothetical protein
MQAMQIACFVRYKGHDHNFDKANKMTAQQYRAARLLRGTQSSVAASLGVDVMTVSRRECGRIPVSKEAELALLALPVKR